MSQRPNQINFRLTDGERERFQDVADYYGIPLAAMIRMLVKERADLLARKGEIEAPSSARTTKA